MGDDNEPTGSRTAGSAAGGAKDATGGTAAPGSANPADPAHAARNSSDPASRRGACPTASRPCTSDLASGCEPHDTLQGASDPHSVESTDGEAGFTGIGSAEPGSTRPGDAVPRCAGPDNAEPDNAEPPSAGSTHAVRVATWCVRAAFALVFAVNVQCALVFVVNPSGYAGAYELSGVAGTAAVQGIGVAFLMWNATYPAVIANPQRFRALGVVVLVQQVVGLAGESFIRAGIPAGHEVLLTSIDRFIAFDAFGLVLMSAAFAALLVTERRALRAA